MNVIYPNNSVTYRGAKLNVQRSLAMLRAVKVPKVREWYPDDARVVVHDGEEFLVFPTNTRYGGHRNKFGETYKQEQKRRNNR